MCNYRCFPSVISFQENIMEFTSIKIYNVNINIKLRSLVFISVSYFSIGVTWSMLKNKFSEIKHPSFSLNEIYIDVYSFWKSYSYNSFSCMHLFIPLVFSIYLYLIYLECDLFQVKRAQESIGFFFLFLNSNGKFCFYCYVTKFTFIILKIKKMCFIYIK